MLGSTAPATTALSRSRTVFRYCSVDSRKSGDGPGVAVVSQLAVTPPGLLPTGTSPGEAGPVPPAFPPAFPALPPAPVPPDWQPSANAKSAAQEIERSRAWFALIASRRTYLCAANPVQ